MSPALNPFDFIRPMSSRAPVPQEPPPPEESTPETNSATTDTPESAEVEELRKRLEELEGMVSRLKRKKPTSRNKAKHQQKR